jgi:hypothetical protein
LFEPAAVWLYTLSPQESHFVVVFDSFSLDPTLDARFVFD